MYKTGAPQFFQAMPLQLLENNMNSLTYAQDSRSWLIPVLHQNLKEGMKMDLDYFVAHFLPLISKLTQVRLLELHENSQIKARKYEILIVQLWQLLPLCCNSNCANMFESLSKLLIKLEKLMESDEFGLRHVALKTFSALINHCRTTKSVDSAIKKTRKGL